MRTGPMTIGIARYYRLTLALPLLVSALVYLLGKTAVLPPLPPLVWFSMVIGGVPYFLLAAFMFFWVRGKPERTVHQVIYVSPFFMVVLLALAVPTFLPVLRGANAVQRGVVDFIARHSIFTLVLGYLYVAAVQSLYLCLKALRRIAPD